MTTIAQTLPASDPEAQGIPSSAILNFVRAAEETVEHLHSFMLLRHGHQVAAGWWTPYRADLTHVLFSLSKSFTSTAVGLAVEEGHFSIEDKVISFFPDDLPEEVSDNLAAMNIWHLLTMSTGHLEDTTGKLRGGSGDNWVRSFLAQPVEHEPGAPFLYNSGATYMLSAIVQTVTGSTVLDYLRPRLLDPLGIGPAKWDSCPRGINTGGWGLNLRTEDIARFGQLYLQQGEWQGQQLVTAAWIEAASSAQVDNSTRVNEDEVVNPDWGQGYGYQFWRCQHDAYRGDGAFGQYCVVMPEQDAVVAITSGLKDMQAVLDLVWEHLLPAMEDGALSADESTHAALIETMGGLKLPVVQGSYTSSQVTRISGQRFIFDEDAATETAAERIAVRAVRNQDAVSAITLDFQNDGCTFVINDGQAEHRIACGHGGWQEGVTTWQSQAPGPVSASGAWIAPDTYQMRVYYIETPFAATVTCRFDDNQVIYDSALNVGFGPLENPQRVGRMG